MNFIYKRICIPLMLVNNNVYTFLSGIFISWSTNIFTSLCYEKSGFFSYWHLYLSTVLFLAAGAMLMYIAVKISKFQNYIIEKRIVDITERKKLVLDATKHEQVRYTLSYLVTAITTILGTILMAFNYFI